MWYLALPARLPGVRHKRCRRPISPNSIRPVNADHVQKHQSSRDTGRPVQARRRCQMSPDTGRTWSLIRGGADPIVAIQYVNGSFRRSRRTITGCEKQCQADDWERGQGWEILVLLILVKDQRSGPIDARFCAESRFGNLNVGRNGRHRVGAKRTFGRL